MIEKLILGLAGYGIALVTGFLVGVGLVLTCSVLALVTKLAFGV
jgi:hypothetical protein